MTHCHEPTVDPRIVQVGDEVRFGYGDVYTVTKVDGAIAWTDEPQITNGKVTGCKSFVRYTIERVYANGRYCGTYHEPNCTVDIVKRHVKPMHPHNPARQLNGLVSDITNMGPIQEDTP